MAHASPLTFPRFLEVFRRHCTRPSFFNLVVIALGWVLTPRTHAVTAALVASGASSLWHHAAFHRFFSTAAWKPDCFGLELLWHLERVLAPGGTLRLVIDDTLAEKRGPHIHGIATHLDPVRSTRAFKVFCFGHVWVVLCAVVNVPFSRRPWALPLLFRLYRSKTAAAKARKSYCTKTELAREMLHLIVEMGPDVRFVVTADNAYANSTVLEGLDARVMFIGAMRPDAVLTAAPIPDAKRRGRPRRRGEVLPKPSAMANDGARFKSTKVHIYGITQNVFYKTCVAQWYRACGASLLRIVVVRCERGTIPFRVYFCTDVTCSVEQIIESYAQRWSIETCFRNLKQLFGFADSSARTEAAVCRTAPFVGLLYSALVLWFTLHVYDAKRATSALPHRPWYRRKTDISFDDILRAAQAQLTANGIPDLPRILADFTKTAPAVASTTMSAPESPS